MQLPLICVYKATPSAQEQGPQESCRSGSGVAQGREECRVSSGRALQQQRRHSSCELSGLFASRAANEIIITRSTDYIYFARQSKGR